jgi:hypothetical protein
MKSAIEVFASMLLIVLLSLVCLGFSISNTNSSSTRDLFYSYKEEIEFSDCSETVINKCIQDAEQKGYTLAVEMIEDGVYKMTFTYNYKAMFFDAGKDVNIVGYVKGGVL